MSRHPRPPHHSSGRQPAHGAHPSHKPAGHLEAHKTSSHHKSKELHKDIHHAHKSGNNGKHKPHASDNAHDKVVEISKPVKPSHLAVHPTFGVMPVGPVPINYGFFDPRYADPKDPPVAQHLGLDLHVSAGMSVYSPVSGVLTINKTDGDVRQCYLVIRENSGVEHVIGHVRCELPINTALNAGDLIGAVGLWSGNAHVHWGINKFGILQAMKDKWGWGRAPASATREQAIARGWIG